MIAPDSITERTNMKLQYFADTDTLAIELVSGPSANTDMITDNLIVDFDANERVVSITIEQASLLTDLTTIEAINSPINNPLPQ